MNLLPIDRIRKAKKEIRNPKQNSDISLPFLLHLFDLSLILNVLFSPRVQFLQFYFRSALITPKSLCLDERRSKADFFIASCACVYFWDRVA